MAWTSHSATKGGITMHIQKDGGYVKNFRIVIPSITGVTDGGGGCSGHPGSSSSCTDGSNYSSSSAKLTARFKVNSSAWYYWNSMNHSSKSPSSYPIDITDTSTLINVYSNPTMTVYLDFFAYLRDSNNSSSCAQKGLHECPFFHFTLDSTPPTISGPAYPASEVNEVSGQTYVKGSTVTVTYTASDSGGSGLAGIWIDGVQASSSGSASKTYTVTSDFTSSAYSRDGEGNQSGTVSKAFKYDNIAPTISNFIVNSATTPVSGQDIFVDYPNTTCDFEFTATDNESGLKSYKATNASGVDTTGSLSGASQTITLSHDLNEANSSKEIKYELEVEDKAGNISTQSSPIVIVDDTPPTGTLAIDSSQTTNVVDGVTYIKTSDVKLSITKSDSESGLF